MIDTKQLRIRPVRPDVVKADVYEELLNRYERVLVFAGQLQARAHQQKLLSENNESLLKEKGRLEKLVALDGSYIHLLEKTLESVGLIKADTLYPDTKNPR
jgi:hypothetical protein